MTPLSNSKEVLTATQVANQPGWPRWHKNTIHRWMRKGCNGVILESFRVGGKRCTTRDHLNKFLADLNGNASQPIPPIQSPRQLAAESRLDAAGI